jgi:6-phosphogluconolactonase
MPQSSSSRRSFLKTGSAFMLAPLLGAQAEEKNGRLLAYVGTYTSPLKNMKATQVDLPPGNGRGIHLFEVDRATGAMTPCRCL